MLTDAVGALGRWGLQKICSLGRSTLMLYHALIGKPDFRKHFPLLIAQIYFVGSLSAWS